MFRKNTPYKRKVIIAVAFLATIVVLVSSPGKKYEADILDKKINTSVPTPEEVLLVSESNSEEDTETPDKTSDKVEAETEEKQEGKTEGKATEQSDKEDNTGTEQAEAEETEQEIKEIKTGEAETPELQEEVADPANKENENTTKNQESEAIGGPETEGIADISEPEAQTEEGKKEVVKGNINEEQAAEENTETEKTPEDAEDAETDTTKDDEKEEIGNINDQEVSKRALGGTAGQKAETLETEETNAIEKEEASEKMQKRTDRIQKRLENTDLSPEKRDVLLARLDRLENPQEKIRIKNLKNEIRNMRREAVLEKNLETEMDVKTIAPIRNKIIQARQQKAAPEKEALKNELKREGKARMERLKAINEELERETEEFIAQELPELTEAEKEEVKKVIEPDFVYELMDEPVEETPLFSDDPQLGEQWAVESIINDQLSIVNEWGTDGDSEPVIVAIIDTGVDLSHEDLAGQFWTSESCVDDLGELIEGGCLFGGYDFVDEDTNPMVEDGATHGTAVAGIIGARTDNGVGIASVSKNGVRVMALKVAEDGLLTSESITRAIHFAILNGADIINMSFGGPTPSAVMEGAIAEAEQAGVIVTAAAGNYGLDNDVTPIYPASYDLGNIISVAALDRDDSLASFSDYGVNSVDIAAPGVSVLSTVPGGYQRVSGTSFSAPMVAAVLSVLPLSESNQTVSLIDFLIPKAHAEEATPTMTLEEFLNLLFNSVQSLTGLEGKVKGGKVLRFGEMGGEEGENPTEPLPELPPLNEVEYTDEPLTIDDLLEGQIFGKRAISEEDVKKVLEEIGSPLASDENFVSYLYHMQDRWGLPSLNPYAGVAIIEVVTGGVIMGEKSAKEEAQKPVWKKCFTYGSLSADLGGWGEKIEFDKGTNMLEEYSTEFQFVSRMHKCIEQDLDFFGRGLVAVSEESYEFTNEYEIHFNFKKEGVDYIEKVVPSAIAIALARYASSKEEYNKWMSFGEGSLYEFYEKLFGFDNGFFDTSENKIRGERKLVPFKSKLVNATEEKIIAQSSEKDPKEIGIGYASQYFPDIPKSVLYAFYLDKDDPYGEKEYRGYELSSARFYQAERYSGLSFVNSNSISNFVARAALLKMEKDDLFPEKEKLTFEEWQEVFREYKIKNVLSENISYGSYNDYDEEYLNQKINIFSAEFKKELEQRSNQEEVEGDIPSTFFLSSSEYSLQFSPDISPDNDWEYDWPRLQRVTNLSSDNYFEANRTADDIDIIVIHSVGENNPSFWGSVRVLSQPSPLAISANFVVPMNFDEHNYIAQLVPIKHKTRHVGNDPISFRSIGIEHESGPYKDENDIWQYNDYTDQEYKASAALVRYLTNKYDVPRYYEMVNGNHYDDIPQNGFRGIIGHIQVPGCVGKGGGVGCHTDPGGYTTDGRGYLDAWNWDSYMSLIQPNHIKVEVIREENKKIQLQDEGDSGIGYFQTGNNTITVPIRITNISNDPEMEGAEKNVPITLREISQASLSKITPDNNQFSLNTLPEIDLDPGVSVDVELTIKLNQPGASSLQLDLSYKTPSEDVPYYFRTKLKVPVGTFADIEDHWGRDYIRYLADETVVAGFSDGLFDPNGTTTRAEVLKMAYEGKKFTIAPQSGDSGFTDVSSTDWFYPYVKHAKDNGYIRGKESCNYTCFAPNEAVNRYEAAKMIYAIFNEVDYSSGKDGSCSSQNFTQVFKDVAQEKWFCEPVQWMAEQEALWNGEKEEERIVEGYKITPTCGEKYFGSSNCGVSTNNITRSEMSKIIANTMRAKGVGPDFFPQEIQLQSSENNNVVSFGHLYEQIFDETNQNAPDPVHLNPDSTDTKTITASETLTITKETHDADNDELFYFWNATGGTFTTSDETNFHEVTWHPPQVTEETVFEINVTRGDGRGLIGEGHFEITVTPDDTPPAPEPLIPTIHSTASGGNWNNAGTWVENRVPTADDVVEINGTVTVYNDETAAGLKVNSGGQLWNRYGNDRSLTVNGDIENAGTIRNNSTRYLMVYVSGNIVNTGSWNNYRNYLFGTNPRHINTPNPLGGTFNINDNFELLSSPEFNGSINFNGKIITLDAENSIIVRGNTSFPVTIIGGGTLIFDGGNQNISGTITAEDVLFQGSERKTINDHTTINGNLSIAPGITVWNRYGNDRSLTVNGDIENAGTIRNNSTRYLMVYVSGNITNTGSWYNYITYISGIGQKQISSGENKIGSSIILNDSFEVIGNPVFSGNVNLNGQSLTVNAPNSFSSGGFSGIGTITGDGWIASSGNISATISGDIPLFKIDGGNQNISGTITAEDVLFQGSERKTIYDHTTINGNLSIAPGITVWNRYGNDRSLTVNGDIENAGTIRNNSTRYLMVYVSGNIVNTGSWNNYRNYLFGTNPRHINTPNPLGGTFNINDNFELLSSPEFNGSINFNGKIITLDAENSIIVRGNTSFPVTIIGGGTLIFDGGNQNISGTITAEDVLFQGSERKTIYNHTTINGNLSIAPGITVWNQYGNDRSLTVNGDIKA
jgi:hypothetical protein